MLNAFLYRFIFVFLITSMNFMQIYSGGEESTTLSNQTPEEKHYWDIQSKLLTEFSKIPKDKSALIGKTIANNVTVKNRSGFSGTFTTYDDIKDKIPTPTSPQSTVIEKSAPIDIVSNNVQQDLSSSSPYNTVLSTDNPLYIDEKSDMNNQKEKDTSDDTESNLSTTPESILLTNRDIFNSNSPVSLSNLNESIYSNAFAHDKKESTGTAQPPVVLTIPKENNDMINPFAQMANAQATESKSSDDSSEERQRNKPKRAFWTSLLCIGHVD